MSLKGELFVYSQRPRLCAFKSGAVTSSKALIFVAGMTEGLMALPWLSTLSQVAQHYDLCLIQVLLSSSYRGFGIGSLGQDAKELTVLLDFLHSHGSEMFILMGHSTGCQSIHTLIQTLTNSTCNHFIVAKIKSLIFHCGISDRDYAKSWPQYSQLKEFLKQSKDNQTLYNRLVDDVAYTRYRLESLLEKGGDDDFFSIDLSADELRSKFRHLEGFEETFVLFAGSDEYVPDKSVYDCLIEAYRHWCHNADCQILKGANHAMDKSEDQKSLLVAIDGYLYRLLSRETNIKTLYFSV